jgi:hypothetical protein
MKKFILSLILLPSLVVTTRAEDYIESLNIVSDNYSNSIEDVQVIRYINGGTVIIPEFDETCPQEMKVPFTYACKIVEEYMPPCLPIKVKISCNQLVGSQRNAISKVLSQSKENFGSSSYYRNATMSTIKGVILGEYCLNTSVTYLDYISDVNSLTEYPDIAITYNKQRLDEIYFSIDTNPGEKYDFVSLAIRDLLIGLGISHSYVYNPVTNGLQNPFQEMTPFEWYIDKKLGNNGDAVTRLANATKGEFSLGSLKLFAPTTWINGVSLRYFIPQDNSCVSKILSYDFCKGMVTRSLNDNYSYFIFRELLGWKYSFPVSTSTPSSSAAGSTSLFMPYNGTFNIDDCETMEIRSEIDYQESKYKTNSLSRSYSAELEQYIEQFFPFLNDGEFDYSSGVSVSILKKNGTWDLVQFIPVYEPNMEVTFNMQDWTFHFSNEEYARTVDGYLKARITKKFMDNFGKTTISSTFIVLGYLPQKVGINFSYTDTTVDEMSRVAATNKNIRLYFSDTEGIDRIVLERLREGFRVPSKIEITDIKKGYYDTTIDRNTTFTAVGYNENGHTRGVPVTVEYQPASVAAALSFDMQNDAIMIKAGDEAVGDLNYSIAPLSAVGRQAAINGNAVGNVDISSLAEGLYVLTAIDEKSGLQGTFKFRK